MGWRAGVDTGGTFTDVVVRDEKGEFFFKKIPSTPDDPSEAIAQGIASYRDETDLYRAWDHSGDERRLGEKRGSVCVHYDGRVRRSLVFGATESSRNLRF